MMDQKRMRIMAGAGAASAAVAAVAVVSQTFRGAEESATPAGGPAYELCLKTAMPLFEDIPASCYDRNELAVLLDRHVLDLQGAPVAVRMMHPTDKTIAARQVRSCRDYREMTFDGWYAETTREQRREGYFVRACGALNALYDAQDPARSFFNDGSPEAEDVAALKGVMRIAETMDEADAVVVETPGAFQWRITVDSRRVDMQELASADFDNDGIEEILVFLAGRSEGGTAVFYDIGFLQKDAAGAALTFTPLSFSRDAAAGPAG